MKDEMKDREFYRQAAPFSVSQAEKEAFFTDELTRLSEYHRRSCKAYDDICHGLNQQMPYLPVALFKDLELRSVPEEEVVRQVTSSGTSGQQVSRIFLDGPTAELQRWALASITGDFIGGKRMPMLIIDSPDVLRDRRKFTARGAGILGFSMMSSKRFYALDADMNLDMEQIEAFLDAAKESTARISDTARSASTGIAAAPLRGDSSVRPSFAFGFTFMIWAYFVQALQREGRTLDLGGCHLIHGGGWKKLQDQKVSDEVFQKTLREVCGIERVSDYYGMAEQTGSIFMQCEQGHLHASIYSDIEILDPVDFSPCPKGERGLIALRSWIPGSYPGHLLLTEDEGRILGTDDCPCGRKGKYFEIFGRIKKAEIRGCSDTFAQDRTAAGQEGDLQVLAGSWLPSEEPVNAFDPLALEFLETLSQLFMKDPAYRQYPDIYALGFWCRRTHLQRIRDRQSKVWENENAPAGGVEEAACGRRGRGLVLHIAPSNMPTMFAYSWITGLLAGNANVVRLSGKEAPISETILQGIRHLLAEERFAPLAERNAFVRFPRGHQALQELSLKASARMIWGGDATVERISSVPAGENALDIPFPDKYSIAVLDAATVRGMTEEELTRQANLFCRDTYGADQNACSSPRSVFWLTEEKAGASGATQGIPARELEAIKDRWWDAVRREAERYELQPWMATEKYRQLCANYAQIPGLGPVKSRTNLLYVVPCGKARDWTRPLPPAKLGIFYEFDLECAEELMPHLGSKIQTAVCIGTEPDQVRSAADAAGAEGLDRAVYAGEALEFDTIWDRKDLIDLLSVKED